MNAYIVHNTTLKADEELWYEKNADAFTILPLKSSYTNVKLVVSYLGSEFHLFRAAAYIVLKVNGLIL